MITINFHLREEIENISKYYSPSVWIHREKSVRAVMVVIRKSQLRKLIKIISNFCYKFLGESRPIKRNRKVENTYTVIFAKVK